MTSDEKNYREFWIKTKPIFPYVLEGNEIDSVTRGYHVDHIPMVHVIEYSAFGEAQKEIEKLKKVVEIQGKALEFYSDKCAMDDFYRDNCGEISRQALKEVKKIMGEM